MRIAFYAPMKPPDDPVPSGDRELGRRIIAALERKGHDVVLASRVKTWLRDPDEAAHRALQAEAEAEADRIIARFSAEGAPDAWLAYHVYFKAPDWIGPRVSASLGVPCVIVEAARGGRRAAEAWPFGFAAADVAMKAADQVAALHREDAEGVAAVVDAQRLRILTPFVDTERFAAPPRSGEGVSRLLAVGMMRSGDKERSYRLLAEALNSIADLPWNLTIVGDGKLRSEVESLFDRDRTMFLGALEPDELPAAYAAADMLVWPAINEAFGMALLEAQAAGLPVIAGDSGGVAEIVRHGETGLVVEEGDAKVFAAAVADLIGNAEKRPVMGAAAARYVAVNHGLDGAGKALESLIRDAIATRARTMKALVWVQHLLGTGHAVRAAALASALRDEGAAVTLVTGNTLPRAARANGVSVVELAPVRTADVHFSGFVTGDGTPADEAFWEDRARHLMSVFEETAPDVVVAETYPFGRRRFRTELDPVLRVARARGILTAASIRDILVRKESAAREEAMAAKAKELCDLVLVHADPAVVKIEESFPPATRIADKVRYTGFIHAGGASPELLGDDGHGEIVVSCGGGAVGTSLMHCALAARGKSTAANEKVWRLLIGQDIEDETLARLQADALGGVIVERARPDFPGLLKRARLSVSQAGYNTVLDVLHAGIPAVYVPFAQGTETEQSQRAEALARRGLAVTADEASLTPGSLAAAVDKAMALSPQRPELQSDGAGRSAEILIGEWKVRQ